MCGILGEVNFSRKKSSKKSFLKILKLSQSRGPNNRGFYDKIHNLQFGFNRLSILDLSSNANQPILSYDKKYLMVFNGEIYNYLDIHKKLIQSGFKTTGNSDTEVLVNSFSVFGVDKTIDLLDGMFAIALFNIESKKLQLIRDFAGIKPLYYGVNNLGIVFSSQFNQIAKHEFFRDGQINYEVLKLYISQQFIPAPFGLIKKTYQVNPGEIITIDMYGKINKTSFWKFSNSTIPSIYDEKEAFELINFNLNKAVKNQLVSDVPLGAFLSGGVDSSLICYYAQKYKKNSLKTINVGSENYIYDESQKALTFSKLIGTDHKVGMVNGSNILNIIRDLNQNISEPFADISVIPTFFASKIAKNYVDVILSGDGADELFFGYERFWSIAKNIRFQHYNYYIKYLFYAFDKIVFDNTNLNSSIIFDKQCAAHFNLHSQFSNLEIELLIPNMKSISFPMEYKNYSYPNTQNEEILLMNMRYAEFYGMMQKTLRKIDLASMANSLEVRVPFLNKTFIESSLRINSYLNFGPNKGKKSGKKRLLKKLLKFQLPKSNIDNIKLGFSIPFRKYLKNELLNEFSQTLNDKNICDLFNIDLNYINKLFYEHKSNIADHKTKIFTLYSLFKYQDSLSK